MGKVASTRRGRVVRRGHGVTAGQRRRIRTILEPIVRIYRLKPDPSFKLVNVEVRLFRSQIEMNMGRYAYEGRTANFSDHRTLGFCCDYYRKTGQRQPRLIWRHVVARVYMNVKDIRREPVDLPIHELGHAALAYARYRRADLKTIEGEEVACYALGRMAAQLNEILRANGAFQGQLR